MHRLVLGLPGGHDPGRSLRIERRHGLAQELGHASRLGEPVDRCRPRHAGAASQASQTDTAWGRIWDTLPGGFPAIPGSTPTDATDGPASAVLVVQGDAAKSIATSMQAALSAAGFRTEGLSGPLEDGSYVLDTAGAPAGCVVQVTAKPLGGVTTVTIMYGAVCQHG